MRLQLDFDSLASLMGLAPYEYARAFARSQGALWWIVGLAAGLASLRRNERRWRPLTIGLLATLASVVVLGERAAIGIPFFLFPLCAAAFEIAGRWIAALGPTRAANALPALGLVLALLWPRDATIPAVTYEPVKALEVYSRLPRTPMPSRTLDVTSSPISLDGVFGLSSFSPYFSGRSIPFGGFPQAAPLMSNVSLALVSGLVSELRSPKAILSGESADFLYLLGVEFLVDRGEPRLREKLQLGSESFTQIPSLKTPRSIGRRRGSQIFQLAHASPAIFAPRLDPLPAELATALPGDEARPRLLRALESRWAEDPLNTHASASLDPLRRTGARQDAATFEPVLRGLGIDRARGTARHFYVEGAVPSREADESETPTEFEVLRHDEALESVGIEARSSHEGFVRLSYGFDPVLRVSLDGRPVEARPDALNGAILVPFPAGQHHVELEYRRSGLRLYLMLFSGLSASGAILALCLPWGRATKGPGSGSGAAAGSRETSRGTSAGSSAHAGPDSRP